MNTMTLEQVRDWLANCAESCTKSSDINNEWCGEMADAIDAHLTAHAQMVEKVRYVIADMLADPLDMPVTANAWADKLAIAIGDSK